MFKPSFPTLQAFFKLQSLDVRFGQAGDVTARCSDWKRVWCGILTHLTPYWSNISSLLTKASMGRRSAYVKCILGLDDIGRFRIKTHYFFGVPV